MEEANKLTAFIIPQDFIWNVRITKTTSLAYAGMINVPPWRNDAWAAVARSISDTFFGGDNFQRATLLRISKEGQLVEDLVGFDDNVPDPIITTSSGSDGLFGRQYLTSARGVAFGP